MRFFFHELFEKDTDAIYNQETKQKSNVVFNQSSVNAML